MANLRTNNLSGEQGQNAYRGSVHFPQVHNSTDYLQLDPSLNPANQFNFLHNGTTDFTIEFWIHPKQGNNRQTVFSTGGSSSGIGFAVRIMETGASGGSNGYQVFCQISRGSSGNYLGFLGGVIDNKGYSHVALVFTTSNKQLAIYINGQLTNSSDLDGTASNTFGSGDFSSSNSGHSFHIGKEPQGTPLYLHQTHLSNLRIVEGKTVYTAEFTPPQSELTAIDGTVILACQDSTDPTQEATGKTVTANGQLTSPDQFKILKHVPPFGVDAGNTFGGPIQQSTEGYMYFPTGRTGERGRGRGLIGGGSSPTNNNSIEFINIQSQGNALDFGDLAVAGQNAGASSSTRALFAMGGQASPGGKQNVIQFVEIATQGNAVDFGDRTITKNGPGGLANQTRAVFAGGGAPVPQSDVMDFVTIASIGNATDFGNMTSGNKNPACTASSTRGIIVHGGDPLTNVIDFITIATAGNAQDFGDATVSAEGLVASSSPTRGIIGGGLVSPAQINNIMFITIATTGNATDFGDLTQARQEAGGISNSIRACFASGGVPSAYNTIDFVTIATRGDALDFGDTAGSYGYRAGASDSHGGLS